MVAALSVLSLTLLVVPGCTGDGESAALQRAFADDPAVESMELTSHDNQPFTGGVSGEVLVREGVADEEFAVLAARVGEYTRENGDRMRGRVSLVVDGFETVVTGDEALDDDAVRLLLVLRADARVTSAAIGETSVAVVGVGTAETIELARDLPALLDGVSSSRRWLSSVRSEDRAADMMGPATVPATAVRLWDALAPEVPLSGIRAREDTGIVVTLQDEADLVRARAAAGAVALEGDTRLAFASDLVLIGDSDGEDARLLLARLDDDMRARVAHVWISRERIQVAVRSEADLSTIGEAIDAALPPRISEAWLVWDGDAETRIPVRSVSEDPGDAE